MPDVLTMSISVDGNTTPDVSIMLTAGGAAAVVFAGLNASITPIAQADGAQPTPITVSDLNVGAGGGISISGSIAAANAGAVVTTTATKIAGSITANPPLTADVVVTLKKGTNVCGTATLKANQRLPQPFSFTIV